MVDLDEGCGASHPSAHGVFFTSIPKAGKNLVYSFTSEIGVHRSDVRREAALWAIELDWLRRCDRRCTYALPPFPGGVDLDAECSTFLARATRMQAGAILHHHFPFSSRLSTALEQAGIRIFFLYRDPRDLLLSMADYILVQAKPVHLAERFAGLGRAELISRLWAGDESLIGFADYLDAFIPWLTSPGVESFGFEDLVGEQGGGTRDRQYVALSRIRALFPRVDESRFARACDRTFNRRAGTFFKGMAARWRDENDPVVREVLASEAMGRLVAAWGYAA